jgi:hypothetical protein
MKKRKKVTFLEFFRSPAFKEFFIEVIFPVVLFLAFCLGIALALSCLG